MGTWGPTRSPLAGHQSALQGLQSRLQLPSLQGACCWRQRPALGTLLSGVQGLGFRCVREGLQRTTHAGCKGVSEIAALAACSCPCCRCETWVAALHACTLPAANPSGAHGPQPRRGADTCPTAVQFAWLAAFSAHTMSSLRDPYKQAWGACSMEAFPQFLQHQSSVQPPLAQAPQKHLSCACYSIDCGC